MIRLLMLLSIAIYFIMSCNNNITEDNNKKDTNLSSIEVIYLKGEVETQIAINCNDITKATARIVDTIITNKQMFAEIANQVRLLKVFKADSSAGCDIRMNCKIKYANGDSTELCIGKINCILKDKIHMKSNDTLIYLIRKYTGYYNYFFKEELQYFNEVKQFSIPSNYKCLIRVNKNRSVPLPPE